MSTKSRERRGLMSGSTDPTAKPPSNQERKKVGPILSVVTKNEDEERLDFDLAMVDGGFHSMGVGDDEITTGYTSDSVFSSTSQYQDYNMKEVLKDMSQLDDLIRPVQDSDDAMKWRLSGQDFGFREGDRLSQLLTTLKEKMSLYGAKRLAALKPFWIDFQSVSSSDIDLIEDLFNLHPLTGHDCIATDVREKWESFGEYLFVVVREIAPENRVSMIHMVPLRIVLFENFILTFHSIQLPSILETLGSLQECAYVLKSADWCLYLILRSLTTVMERRVSALILEVLAVDELIICVTTSNNDADDLLGRIRNANGQMSSLFWMICIKQDIFLSISSKRRLHISPRTQVYLRSLLDDVIKMRFDLQVERESLEASHSAYLAMISVNNSETSNRTNELMKSLSSVATILLPLTLLVGLFGMNVTVPGQNEEDLEWFIGICAGTVFTGILNYVYFRKKHYI